MKNHDSINIYGWDYSTGVKKGDFFKISVQNLRASEKDARKSEAIYLEGNFLRISKIAPDFS